VGQEAHCTARLGGKVSKGKARLESSELIFRGDFRLVIPFQVMQSVSAAKGVLCIKFPQGTAYFELGGHAEKWAHKILHPKSLLDKLGVKPGAAVSILGVTDVDFRKELAERTPEISESEPRKDSDLIVLGAEHKEALVRLKSIASFLKKSGALWIVYPKGQSHITENDVLTAGKKTGLVDVKVVSFSATHTALKFVIPVARR